MENKLLKCYVQDVSCGDCEYNKLCNIFQVLESWKK